VEPVTLLGIVAFVVTQTYLILRTMNNAKAKADEATAASEAAAAAAKDASTRQQDAMTAQFTVFSNENRRLQSRVDALETANNSSEAAFLRISAELVDTKRAAQIQRDELKLAQERAGRLETEVKTLTEKVAVLDAALVARAGELERERMQVQTTNRALQVANEQIASLRDRVSRLEGENEALNKLLKQIRVVLPEPDPDPPPTKRVIPMVEPEEKTA
jgi:chromosome segregation ATPase